MQIRRKKIFIKNMCDNMWRSHHTKIVTCDRVTVSPYKFSRVTVTPYKIRHMWQVLMPGIFHKIDKVSTLAAKKIPLFGELVENVVKTFGYFYPKRIVKISECSPNKNRNDYGRIFSEKNRNDFVTIYLWFSSGKRSDFTRRNLTRIATIS